MALKQSAMIISDRCSAIFPFWYYLLLSILLMQRSMLMFIARSLLLLQTCFQAKASPVSRNFPSKDSLSGYLTVIFSLALLLTILFIFKKVYVVQRRKTDPVSTFSDDLSAQTSNQSMTKAITKRSGFYVGLLGSPGWETKHSVFVGGGPSSQSESRTKSCRFISFGSMTTTVSHKVPAQCETTPTRPASSDVSRHQLQPLGIVLLSPDSELSRPSPAKHPGPYLDTKSSPRTRLLSSPFITKDNHHGDFHSNKNIPLNSGLNSLEPRPDHFTVSPVSPFSDFTDEFFSSTYKSSTADIATPTQTSRTSMKYARLSNDLSQNSIQQSTIKPLYFGSIQKRHACTVSENSQQIYDDDLNDSILKTTVQDFSALSSPKAAYQIPDSFQFCRLSVDLSSSSVRLNPRCSTATTRTRNSPIIGPSPLRTMSFPLDYDLEYTKQFNVNSCDTPSKAQSETKFEPSLESPLLSHSPSFSRRSKTVFQAGDPDILLDLIHELAQEASAWDASLFVDENFKALVDQSARPNYKLQNAKKERSKYRQRRRRTISFTPLQDIPECDGRKRNL